MSEDKTIKKGEAVVVKTRKFGFIYGSVIKVNRVNMKIVESRDSIAPGRTWTVYKNYVRRDKSKEFSNEYWG